MVPQNPAPDPFDPAALAEEDRVTREVLSRQLGRPAGQIVKLDANENPYGMLPAVRNALAALPFPNVYPDPGSQDLRRALAEYHGLEFENILAGAGAIWYVAPHVERMMNDVRQELEAQFAKLALLP